MTPLHLAVQGKHLEVVKYLVNNGANVYFKEYLYTNHTNNETPLDLAVKMEDNENFVEFLINHGASMNLFDLNIPLNKCRI